MQDILSGLSSDLGPSLAWIAMVVVLVMVMLLLYLGVALRATLRAQDPEKRKICYQLFKDLLDLFCALFRSGR